MAEGENKLSLQQQIQTMANAQDTGRGNMVRKFQVQKARQERILAVQKEQAEQIAKLTEIVNGLLQELGAFDEEGGETS